MHNPLGLLLLPLCLASILPSNIEPRSKNHVNSIDCQSADDLIKELNLTSSTEKGYFFQTFQDPVDVPGTNRSYSTAIYYLLEGASGYSLWHKLDAPEVWHYYAGAPLSLYLSTDNGSCVREHVLGLDFSRGQRPQAVVNRDEWQRAKSHGEWTLVGTTVAPGFEVGGQVLQPEGWEPQSC